jgi:exopolysaccharide biosynthesis WecB/TagA/CpsF family protein
MIDRGKHNVLGVRIDAVDYEASVERIVAAARKHQPLAASALAVHGVMTGALDGTHRYRLNRLDLVVPDGQPVRWALNRLHRVGLADRVYGPNLMLDVCGRAAEEEIPIFLFGGSPELLDALQRKLAERFPRLRIADVQPSRFRRMTPAEKAETVRQILDSGAGITLVGLGCPRQEVWVYEFREALSMPLLAVGAAFNFHAGRLSQAPAFMQRHGLEWLYRLACEPRRLWKRYLLLNPLYVTLCALQLAALRIIDPDGGTPPSQEILYG